MWITGLSLIERLQSAMQIPLAVLCISWLFYSTARRYQCFGGSLWESDTGGEQGTQLSRSPITVRSKESRKMHKKS